MKYCRYCNLDKLETEFSFRVPGKLKNKCKQCVAAYTRLHYVANRTAYKLRATADRPQAAMRWKDFVSSLKVCCSECGEDHPATLDFHHTDPNTKEHHPADLRGSKARFLAEIEKCVVLCSNCHRKLHWRERTE